MQELPMVKCKQCGAQMDAERADQYGCPQCGAPYIPDYPRFKGQWVFMVIWVLLILLIVGFFLQLYTI